ncbi:MAG: HEPN domain-containing protein [Planctomycetota bacterium]
MKATTGEWVQKAEGDFLTAEREFRASGANYDAVAFHAQQRAEKYLKARLVEAGVSFPKTHDLAVILNLAVPLEPPWERFRRALDALTSLGIEVRYPGVSADREDATEALNTARAVREAVRSALGMES